MLRLSTFAWGLLLVAIVPVGPLVIALGSFLIGNALGLLSGFPLLAVA